MSFQEYDYWGSRGGPLIFSPQRQIVQFLGASSVSRVIEKFDYNSKRTLKKTITVIPGLSFNQNKKTTSGLFPPYCQKEDCQRFPRRNSSCFPRDSWVWIISDVAWDPRKVYSFRNFVLLISSWLLRFSYLGRCLVAGSSKSESIRTPQTWHDHMQNLRWESIWKTTLLLLVLWCGTPHDARMYWFLSFCCQKFSRSDTKRAPPLHFVRWKWTRNADSRRLRHEEEPPRRRKHTQTASNAGQTRRLQKERQRQVRICMLWLWKKKLKTLPWS